MYEEQQRDNLYFKKKKKWRIDKIIRYGRKQRWAGWKLFFPINLDLESSTLSPGAGRSRILGETM